ncbi:DNA-packaging protein [Rhizorhapis sp.]|uniref:DNA-packaging protein n=1 Tax=Rhizorhapis sp. TaxID=1968842 RepID=UPI002B487AB7|nr:terminase family protein [Rhizorhapis sp.]HKR17006.1 terminase family protein [Rhizorhapis sp.]
MEASFAQRLAGLPEKAFLRLLRRFPEEELEGLVRNWEFWSRAGQREPEGDWRVWLLMAGRGFGKTRAGAEWVRSVAEADGAARIALVGATLHEARSVMVEGPSGLLAIAPEGKRPVYAPSLRRLVWRSGAQAMLYGAAEPESLRGPEHSHGWADEIAKWPDGEGGWDNLMMGMRMGARPRIVATTTPRPVPLVRRLVRESDVVMTRGRTGENRMNLPGSFLAAMEAGFRGTRLGRQELDGELIEEIEGALWSRELIERRRVRAAPAVRRMVIGVDPPASAHGDVCGIVAVALCADGRAYVVADASVAGRSPEGWARAVAEAAQLHGADRVIAEANNGGAMVESVLRAADFALPVRLVHAARGKVARAEPVAALYEAGKALHCGAFPELEDEMCGLMTGGGYEGPGRSPDRADALVWAMTEVMLGSVKGGARVRVL